VLGLTPDASQDEINSAYRRLVRQHHPDTRPASDSSATLAAVLAAHDLLRDPARRGDYDRRHRAPAVGTPAPPDIPPAHAWPSTVRTRFTIRVSPVRYHGPPR
jgi:molecular chaperone DnaJ